MSAGMSKSVLPVRNFSCNGDLKFSAAFYSKRQYIWSPPPRLSSHSVNRNCFSQVNPNFTLVAVNVIVIPRGLNTKTDRQMHFKSNTFMILVKVLIYYVEVLIYYARHNLYEMFLFLCD